MAPTIATPREGLAAGAKPQVPAETTAPEPVTLNQRWLLRVALFLAAAWWLALVALCLLTANPPLVSAEQIARSDVVVTARIDPVGNGQVVVERVWSGDLELGKIRVLNLRDAGPRVLPGNDYVVPLTRFGGHYRITTLDGQNAPPIIYPATLQNLELVQQALLGQR